MDVYMPYELKKTLYNIGKTKRHLIMRWAEHFGKKGITYVRKQKLRWNSDYRSFFLIKATRNKLSLGTLEALVIQKLHPGIHIKSLAGLVSPHSKAFSL